MKKHLNNKGYMLVEIILAAAIAMGVVYFITELTIKLKNKNDDLLVKTLVYTDQAIIYNTIMKDLYDTTSAVDCKYIEEKLDISNNVFKYAEFTNIVSEYAELGESYCTDNIDGSITISIALTVKQLQDENFNVLINFIKE